MAGAEDLFALVVVPIVQDVLHEDAVALGKGRGGKEVAYNQLHLYVDKVS